MPLVIFNYNADGTNRDGVMEDGGEFVFTQELPTHVQDKRWSLRAVNAVYYPQSGPKDFRFMDLKIPELMTRHSVLYSGLGKDVPAPDDYFRFYRKNYELSPVENALVDQDYSELNVFACISEYPNWDLGEHHLENPHLTFKIRSGFGNVNAISESLEQVSIILSYEE